MDWETILFESILFTGLVILLLIFASMLYLTSPWLLLISVMLFLFIFGLVFFQHKRK